MGLGPIIDEFLILVAGTGHLDIEEDPERGTLDVLWSYKTSVGASVPFHMGFHIECEGAALTASVEGDEVEPAEALDTARDLLS